MARWILATGGFYLQGLPVPDGEGFELSYSSGSWADWKQRLDILHCAQQALICVVDIRLYYGEKGDEWSGYFFLVHILNLC